MSLEETFKESLAFPYCSATHFYRHVGIHVPERFGDNCYEQSKRLVNRLEVNGIKARLLKDLMVGRHHSVVAFHDGKEYYLNPYFMHREPILISEDNEEHEAYPLNGNRMITTVLFGKLLMAEKRWPKSKRKDKFMFDLSASVCELSCEEYTNALLHPEQKTVSIRAIDYESADVLHACRSNEDKSFFCLDMNGRYLRGTRHYDRIIDSLSALIRSNSSEIHDFLWGAGLLREEMLKSRDPWALQESF
jgi:hypothetical protein